MIQDIFTYSSILIAVCFCLANLYKIFYKKTTGRAKDCGGGCTNCSAKKLNDQIFKHHSIKELTVIRK